MKYFKTFEGKNIGILYHFTSLINTFLIIQSNSLSSNREVHEDDKNVLGKGGKEYFNTYSFTRNKNLPKAIGNSQIDTPLSCRITFDGNKLSNKFKFVPYNWMWEYDKKLNNGEKVNKNGKIVTVPLIHSKHISKDESEEVIIYKKSYIDDIKSYILNIDTCTLEQFKTELEYYIHTDNFFDTLESILSYFDLDNENDDEISDELTIKLYNLLIKYINKNF